MSPPSPTQGEVWGVPDLNRRNLQPLQAANERRNETIPMIKQIIRYVVQERRKDIPGSAWYDHPNYITFLPKNLPLALKSMRGERRDNRLKKGPYAYRLIKRVESVVTAEERYSTVTMYDLAYKYADAMLRARQQKGGAA